MLHERGIDVSYETVRYWCNRFGPLFSSEIRKRRVRHGSYSNWCWHLDEVFVRINGKTHYLWRAVDHEGEVLEVYVTKRRDHRAALEFLRRAMRRYGRPSTIVTDRLQSYRAAMKDIGITGLQVCGQWLNNRAENSHQAFRRREKAMARFRDIKTLQKFASVHAPHPQSLQPPTSLSSQPQRHLQTIQRLCPGRMASTCCLKILYYGFFSSGPVGLTMPWEGRFPSGLH